jgi:transaldolase
MGRSLLEQLEEHTVVVADSGDLRSIARLRPREATTNALLLTAAAQMPECAEVIDRAIEWARREGRTPRRTVVLKLAIDRLAVELGLQILALVPGRVSTEVDARLARDTHGTVEKARHLIAQYEAAGADRTRVLMKIAATWEGIRAAELLEKEGIRCNVTLVFGLHQAVACAEAGVTLISPFVGRILDWHLKHGLPTPYAPGDDPGVQSVKRIYNYFKRHGYKTEVMAASLRGMAEILELAGCDLVTVAPRLLTELASREGVLERKLDPARAAALDIERVPVDEASFRELHARDRMASDKLAEGIEGFIKAQVVLERLLDQRLTGHAARAARELFSVFDLDGDGFITREEWSGLASVFDVLDLDGDGRITPEEMGLGLGAAFQLR